MGDVKEPTVLSLQYAYALLGVQGPCTRNSQARPALAKEDYGSHLEACVGGRALIASMGLGIRSKCCKRQKLELESEPEDSGI